MFIEDERALWRLTGDAKVVRIEFPVKPTGTRTAEFEVGGLDRAKLLLETTKWPLARIADRSGLGSAATLARAFRRQLGITPEDYRARFRHGTELKVRS